MRLPELALLYSVVGVGCALALLVARRRSKGAGSLVLDAALLAPFWPLYGPFLLLKALPPEAATAEASGLSGQVLELPLSSLLPDDETARALEARLELARARVAEIDRLLADPDFDEEVALERKRQLEARGDVRAAATARGRAASIRQLRQLQGQAEVVRLAGESDRSASEGLLDELRLRLETLDEMLACTSLQEV